MDSRDLLRAGLVWQIGDRREVQFWSDRWLEAGILGDLAPRSLADLNSEFRVLEVLDSDGSWDMTTLEALLPNALVDQICSLPRPVAAQLPDSICWSATPDGRFTVKSTFNLLQLDSENASPANWDWIWKLPCLERIRTFVWQLSHNRLLTNLSQFCSHLTSSPGCPWCPEAEESISHLFRICPKARETWRSLVFVRKGFSLNLLSHGST